jgi:hypothetical protein
MPQTTTPKYPSTQQELNSIADTIYDSLEIPEILAAFEEKKPGKYTAGFIVDLRTRKTTAFNFPDEEQRNSIHEAFKVELIGLKVICCDNFQDLKGYIHDGFPKNLWKVKYDEAGMTVYESASHNNWENLVALNKRMKDFIALYPTELTAGFMPAGFSAKVSSDTQNFDAKYAEFKTARGTYLGTGAKINANNLVYEDLQNLQNDAHMVFRYKPEALKLFMFSVVKAFVSPPGSASLGIDIIEEGTNLPLANATITIQSATGIAITKTSNDLGQVNFPNIDPDNYRVKIQPAGKREINLVKEVNTGVSARLKVTIPA